MVSLALKCRGREVEGPGAAGTAGIYPLTVLCDFDCLTWGGISLFHRHMVVMHVMPKCEQDEKLQ